MRESAVSMWFASEMKMLVFILRGVLRCVLYNRLFQEKLGEIDNKIQTVSEGNAPEYLHPQRDLQRTLSKRMETAETHLRCKVRCHHCPGLLLQAGFAVVSVS